MPVNTDLLKKLSRKWVGQIGAAGVSDDTGATISLSSTTNLATDTAVVATIDRVDANGLKTPTLEESIIGVVSGSNLVTCTRGVEGTAQAHAAGAVVEILVTAKGYNDIIDHLLVGHTQLGAHTNSLVTTLKATGAVVNTGTSDVTIVTPKAIANSYLSLTGVILPYSGATAPTGWLLADGSTISQTTYANLFALIGHTYGADPGSGNFILPNPSGRVIVGKSADTEFDVLGETGGEKTHTLSGAESGEKGHNHTQDVHTHAMNTNITPGTGTPTRYAGSSGGAQTAIDLTATATNQAVAASNATNAHNNLQPYLTLNYIIKY